MTPRPIQIRRGTLSDWTSANPILSPGEMGYETDEKRIRIGDGDAHFLSLPTIDSSSETVPFAIPSPTGEGIQPDLSNGNYQYCWINTDTTLIAPTPAPTASVLYFEIQYANGAYLLDFDASIKMPAAVRAVLPVTLEIWKSYLITLRVIGGVWCLVSITGPNTEVVD